MIKMINRLTLYQQLLTTTRNNFRSLVGVVQLCASNDTEENFQKNKNYIELCSSRGAKLVCLPENFHCITNDYEESVLMAESITGPTIKRYR